MFPKTQVENGLRIYALTGDFQLLKLTFNRINTNNSGGLTKEMIRIISSHSITNKSKGEI